GPGWGPEPIFQQMLAMIRENAALLEVGCGPGGLWKNRIDRVPAGWRIMLTDLMPGMVAEASAAVANDPRFNVRQMDAHKLDFADESFDAVIANYMLYHVEDRPKALREIARVLKSGGKLFASTNSDSHMAKIRRLLDEFLGADPVINDPGI